MLTAFDTLDTIDVKSNYKFDTSLKLLRSNLNCSSSSCGAAWLKDTMVVSLPVSYYTEPPFAPDAASSVGECGMIFFVFYYLIY